MMFLRPSQKRFYRRLTKLLSIKIKQFQSVTVLVIFCSVSGHARTTHDLRDTVEQNEKVTCDGKTYVKQNKLDAESGYSPINKLCSRIGSEAGVTAENTNKLNDKYPINTTNKIKIMNVKGGTFTESQKSTRNDNRKTRVYFSFYPRNRRMDRSTQMTNSAWTKGQDRHVNAASFTDLSATILRNSTPQFQSVTSIQLNGSIESSSLPFFNTEKQSKIDVTGISSSTCNGSPAENEERHTEGHLEWEEPMNVSCCCDKQFSWHIKPSADNYGLVFHLTHFNLKQNESLEVYKGGERKEDKLLMRFPNLTTAVQLLHHQEVYVWVRTLPSFPFSVKNPPSSFSLKYITHPLDHMPLASPLDPVLVSVAPLVAENHMFNCSPPYTIPSYIRCDTVQQCVRGEDEPADCPYKSANCGEDWFPLQHKCFTVITGSGYSNRKNTCDTKPGGKLAILPKPAERRLVGNVISRLGIQNIYLHVDLNAFIPSGTQLELYKYMWTWGQKANIVNHGDVSLQHQAANHKCSSKGVLVFKNGKLSTQCESWRPGYISPAKSVLCMKPAIGSDKRQKPGPCSVRLTLRSSNTIHYGNTSHGNTFLRTFPGRTSSPLSFRSCSDDSFVHAFRGCPFGDRNIDWSPQNLKLFDCLNGDKVHYSLVCDAYEDCPDGSDEYGCTPLRYQFSQFFRCSISLQTVPISMRCNGIMDCPDLTDEEDCGSVDCAEGSIYCENSCVPLSHVPVLDHCDEEAKKQAAENLKEIPVQGKYIYPPAVLHLDGFGTSRVEKLEEDECPDTHFGCPEGFCIPTYLVNNSVLDCPLGHDENIGNLTCPGFYRCLKSSYCLHPDFLCDGINHCPEKDDERYCHFAYSCPNNCICEGLAIKCSQVPYSFRLPSSIIRSIDISRSNRSGLEVYSANSLLFANLSFCYLTYINFWSKSLRIIDLSYNKISDFRSAVLYFPELQHLNLSFNPLSDLGYIFTALSHFHKLRSVTLKGMGLKMIVSNTFLRQSSISVMDITFNPDVEANDTEIFGKSLQVLYTDNAKLCCPHFHPTGLKECHAPVDELSSCSDLLKSDVLRVLLWALSAMALTGNMGVLLYRGFLEKQGTSLAYRALVINLSTADFLMGIYMTIIGGADIFFRGIYVIKAKEWQQSHTCKAAGFLAMLSSEVSAFVLCLITLDRLLVLCFPFNKQLHLSKVSASLACASVWIAGIVLATVPLSQLHWNFYSQNGICLPLPITRQKFDGQRYAFGVFIILNFTFFLFIGSGQFVIYHSIWSSSRATGKDTNKKEVIIARRLFLIVFTDFCCWFPIGLMGLLAARNTSIPGLVSVWAAVFVLPLNSALNPFLYTISMLLERRAKIREQKRFVQIMSNLQAEMRAWPRDKVKELLQHFLRFRLVEQVEIIELMLHNPRSGIGEREQAMELMLHCLRSGLVDLEHLRNVWTYQHEERGEGIVAEVSVVELRTGTSSAEQETGTTLVEVYKDGVTERGGE